MAYRLKRSEPVGEGVRRIATEQLDRALRALDEEDDVHDTVHDVRKRVKKLRGLLRLVRPVCDAYDTENERLRDAARTLSRVRDATARIETVDALQERFAAPLDADAFAELRSRLVRRRDEIDVDEVRDTLRDVRDVLAGVRSRVSGWTVDERGFDAVEGGLRKTYGRALEAMERAYLTDTSEAFHEWRKRVKYHWYHLRLLEEAWPAVVQPWADEAHRLADELGSAHDLVVLAASLDDPGPTTEAALAVARRWRKGLEQDARPLGERLLAESPKVLAGRLRTWWCAS